MEMMLEVAMRVMDTEDDKVADMVLKIPDVITDVTGEEFLEDRDSRSCRHDSWFCLQHGETGHTVLYLPLSW